MLKLQGASYDTAGAEKAVEGGRETGAVVSSAQVCCENGSETELHFCQFGRSLFLAANFFIYSHPTVALSFYCSIIYILYIIFIYNT